jgi:hypothetical protein
VPDVEVATFIHEVAEELVGAIARTASATVFPWPTNTSACRSFATISSGVCAFFLAIPVTPLQPLDYITGGPLLRGQVTGERDLPTQTPRPAAHALRAPQASTAQEARADRDQQRETDVACDPDVCSEPTYS